LEVPYAVALRLVLRNVRKDSIAPAQRTSVIVGGMVGALLGAKALVWLQHIDLLWQNPQQLLFILLQGKTVVGALLGGVIGVEITKKMIGVNRSTGDVFVYPLQQRCVRGVTFQPIQAAGRLEGFNPKRDRYTLTEVRRAILQQSPYFKPEDILPVPCHPDCLAMAYALKLNGKVIPLTGLINPDK
jgi:hypothetical protein